MFKENCFAYKKLSSGIIICTALKHINCVNCKFFKTSKDYNRNVLPLKNKKGDKK